MNFFRFEKFFVYCISQNKQNVSSYFTNKKNEGGNSVHLKITLINTIDNKRIWYNKSRKNMYDITIFITFFLTVNCNCLAELHYFEGVGVKLADN